MANSFQGGRQTPTPLVESGKGYDRALAARGRAITSALMNLLPSNYESTVIGPNYTLFLKAFGVELARVTLVLERVAEGMSFERVPSEFLWETLGYLVFLNGQIPDLGFDDESFRAFLLAVVRIYFQGSTPEAIAEGIALFTDATFTIRELYEEAQDPGSIYDISDQFGFLVDFEVQGQFPTNPFELDANTRLLLEIIRPAHTLYRLRFVFGEDVGEIIRNITDDLSWELRVYHYEEVRKYCEGLLGFTSSTGAVASPNLNLITDLNHLLESVHAGARLTVFSGPNTGIYEVVSVVGSALDVYPPLRVPQTDIAYKVERDRLGHKKEISVVGEVGRTSIAPSRLVADAGGPYSVASSGSVVLAPVITGAAGALTYAWDLTGDNVYDDALIETPTFTAGVGPDSQVVSLRVVDDLGRETKAFATITILP